MGSGWIGIESGQGVAFVGTGVAVWGRDAAEPGTAVAAPGVPVALVPDPPSAPVMGCGTQMWLPPGGFTRRPIT